VAADSGRGYCTSQTQSATLRRDRKSIGDLRYRPQKQKPPLGAPRKWRTPSDIWARRVTICIAGHTCLQDGTIVTVSDKQMSFDDEMPAVENMPKDWRLHDDWGYLLAGNPAFFDPLSTKIGIRMREIEDQHLDP